MKIIDWLKDILGFGEDDFDDIEINFNSESAESLMESLAKASRRRRTLNMNDKQQREQYVREYCDMMAVASKDVDAQKVEYQQVTQRLADLEELEKLPLADKSQVRIRANRVIKIEQEDSNYTRPSKKITESQYREMERLAKEIPTILAKMKEIKGGLDKLGISVKIDDRENVRSGFKFAESELKGVPVRLAMGPRDLENNTVEVARRDTLTKENMSMDGIVDNVKALLDQIEKNIYAKALAYRDEHIYKVDTWDDFKAQIEKGGFLLCHWDGTSETEARIQEETKATIRCIPFDAIEEEGKCIYSGKPSHRRVVFARSY